MSETPKKKTPAKKQAQKKPATPKGTGKPGRPKKVVSSTVEPKPKAEETATKQTTSDPKPAPQKEQVVIHATSVKKRSLRERMMKWFK